MNNLEIFCFTHMPVAYLENFEYRMASKEMLDSRWARQTPNRAKRLSDIIGEL